MQTLGFDAVFVHTADNVFYLSGVPLLSEWGALCGWWSATTTCI
jgi:hypothetical protein